MRESESPPLLSLKSLVDLDALHDRRGSIHYARMMLVILVLCLFWKPSYARQEVVFTPEEGPVAIELIASGVDPPTVLFDVGLWEVIRSQMIAYDVSWRAWDFAPNLDRPLTSSGRFHLTTSGGEVVQLDVSAYSPIDASSSHWPAGFSERLEALGASVAYVGGICRRAENEPVVFLGLAVTREIAGENRTVSSLILVKSAPICERALDVQDARSILGDVIADWPNDPTTLSHTAGRTAGPAIIWSCVACASCAGAAGISCGILCVADGYWDTPGEGTLTCFSKCLKSVQGADPIFDTACFAACLACGFRGAFPEPTPLPPPVRWEVFSSSGLLEPAP